MKNMNGLKNYREIKDILHYKVYFKYEVKSTQDDIYNFELNTILLCLKQNKGRGRYKRKWESNGCNLLFSMTTLETNSQFKLAVALYLTIKNMFNLDCYIKYPNDLMLYDKKIAGILVEKSNDTNLYYAGLGLNLVSSPEYANNLKDHLKDHKNLKPFLFLNSLLKNFEKVKNINYIKILNSVLYKKYEIVKEYKILRVNQDGFLIVLKDNKELYLDKNNI